MNKRSIVGILVVAVGLLMLAGSFGFEVSEDIWSYWPVVLIAIGLLNLTDGGRNYLFSGGFVLVGTIFLLKNMGVSYLQKLEFWEVIWPIIIIIVGVWFLTSKRRSPFAKSESSDEEIDTFVIFGGSNTLNQSQDFKGGQASAVFGGIDLDLRGANIQNGPAKMDVFAAFGGVDIKVPDHWKVKVKGVPIFGGWGNKTVLKEAHQEVDLEINCLVVFGGFDVKN